MGVLTLMIFGIALQRSMVPTIDPAAYRPLLDTIAKGESNGNYDAYFGNAGNTTVHFTDMTIAEVMQWQKNYVAGGSISSAVGRYQIIRPTLAGLVRQLGIDPQTARFDPALQDQLAITLMTRRGAVAYVQKKLTREQFAANLAKEWASLPKISGADPGQSYYAADGVNRARVSVGQVYHAVDNLKN
jgi:muramidase (phage lysozyme)